MIAMEAATKVRVEVSDVSLAYGRTQVLHGVSLVIEPGEFFALLGPSGSGKSTLLRLIAGFIQAQSGSILIGGEDVSRVPPWKRDIGMVFQSYALWPHMTVAQNVTYGLELRKIDKDTIARKLSAILTTTHLADLADRYPGELSGGQQQRVALARALIVDPETLLLDEPLSNLDANLREEMRFEVRRLHDEYRYTTVYVTHDQSEAMTTADIIAVMNLGKIEQAGSPEEIYERPRSEFVARFIGMSNVVRGKALDKNHISVAGETLRCIGDGLAAGADASVSVRQHVIRLWASKPDTTENILPAKVLRQVFLGSSRDYMVEAADGTQIRVVASPAENVEPGSSVWLHLPPERCRVLAG